MTIFTFFALSLIATVVGYLIFDMTNFKVGEIIITPILGIMLGCHYHKNKENDDTNHTFQCSLFFLINSFHWTT